jgi:ribosomal protein S18 acetylase RimI-like enzyme
MPSSQFTIRPATAADEGPLGELDRRVWSPVHAVTPEPAPPYPPFFASGSPDDCLVAEMPEHGVVGYVRAVPATSLASNAHVRQIRGLAVDEAARGSGVGRALLEAACDRARAEGARRITLRVLGPNVPARGLYTAAGFEVEGVLPEEFHIEGAYVDDVLMGRSLLG